jgi:hypothetical protein
VPERLLRARACECNSVSCADPPSFRNRRMLSCSRAVCQQPLDERQQGQIAPRIPFHFTFLSWLGISQPLHIPVKETDCHTAARCLQSRGLGTVRMGSRNGGAMRSSGGSIHEPVAWLEDGVGSVGGVLLVPTSSLVRMTVGFIAVSDRLLASRPLLGSNRFCVLFARGSLFILLSMTRPVTAGHFPLYCSHHRARSRYRPGRSSHG